MFKIPWQPGGGGLAAVALVQFYWGKPPPIPGVNDEYGEETKNIHKYTVIYSCSYSFPFGVKSWNFPNCPVRNMDQLSIDYPYTNHILTI